MSYKPMFNQKQTKTNKNKQKRTKTNKNEQHQYEKCQKQIRKNQQASLWNRL
jgi:hypothetical protein